MGVERFARGGELLSLRRRHARQQLLAGLDVSRLGGGIGLRRRRRRRERNNKAHREDSVTAQSHEDPSDHDQVATTDPGKYSCCFVPGSAQHERREQKQEGILADALLG
jgi:hypothetical protein